MEFRLDSVIALIKRARMNNSWPMREARTQLSRVVRAALAEGPQVITQRGQPVVQVMSVEEFERLGRPRRPDCSREGKR